MAKKTELRKEATNNRFTHATKAEKEMFTLFTEMLVAAGLTHKVAKKELEGTVKQKYVFALKSNSSNIHTLEFLVGKGEDGALTLKGVRVFAAGSIRGTELAITLGKISKDVKIAYGDRVYTYMNNHTVALKAICEAIA